MSKFTRAEAPSFLVYVYGHLRSFPLISHQQAKQWDAFADGAPYLIFLHTWDRIDHGHHVWWRKAGAMEPLLAQLNITALLQDPQTNGLQAHLAAVLVERHPGLPHSNMSDSICVADVTCVADAAAQVDELGRVHALAGRYMRESGVDKLLGEHGLARLPVIRSRPDVTFRSDINNTDGTSVRFARVQPLSELTPYMSSCDARKWRCIYGYRGPWWGGWYATPHNATHANHVHSITVSTATAPALLPGATSSLLHGSTRSPRWSRRCPSCRSC